MIKRRRITLGLLVLVTTLTLVLLFGLVNFYWVRREMTTALTAELETRGLHHAHSLALQVTEAMLIEDRLRLNRLVEEARSLDKEIAYVFVADAKGELIAHTFGDGFPVELLQANRLPTERDYMVRRIVDTQGRFEPIREVVVPVAGGYAGFVHVGLTERLILTSVQKVGRAVSGMVGVLVLIGIAASLAFARFVTHPVQKLAAVSRLVNLEVLQDPQRSQAELRPPLSSIPGLETEVDRLAEEFDRMMERLTEAYRRLDETQRQLVLADRLSTIGTIAARLAHELNNPLAGIKNCLRRVQREPENRRQLYRYVSLMQESVERMQQVLQGLLDLARPRHLEVRPFPLEQLLDRVTVLAGHKLAKSGIAARREIHPDVTIISADEIHLEQATLNLCSECVRLPGTTTSEGA